MEGRVRWTRPQTINKGCNHKNSGEKPEFLLSALSAAANPVIYVYVNSRIMQP